MEVTIMEILEARERRAEAQKMLLARFDRPLISYTMNIAGPVKTSSLIEKGFLLGLRRLEGQLLRLGCPVLHREIRKARTGWEGLFVLDAPADLLKEMTMDLEEADAFGRLLDLDVLTPDGEKLDRPAERGCLICGKPGRGCARSRAHTVAELQEKTIAILTQALAKEQDETIGQLAARALLFEAAAAPKPGLVDRKNNGSHRDMDLFTFLTSVTALTPYFRACAALGRETASLPPAETFARLRRPGRLAEGEMRLATDNVNTHKGAIFLMGILCGAAGRLGLENGDLLKECAAMTAGVTADLRDRKGPATAGQVFYDQCGFTGIRGEVEGGLPSVERYGLPALEQAREAGSTLEEAGCKALLSMMAQAQDTALLHRGGLEGWQWARERAGKVSDLDAFDREMIERNLSPGGCADLLAACYFLYFLKEYNPWQS